MPHFRCIDLALPDETLMTVLLHPAHGRAEPPDSACFQRSARA